MMSIRLDILLEVEVSGTIAQLRGMPVSLGKKGPEAVLAVHCGVPGVDSWNEAFFYPQDTLKLALFTTEGEILWERDLGPGVVPGNSFCPVFAFDLDGDGRDEIWFVNNLDENHPFAISNYRLERVDAETGRTLGRWPWPDNDPHQTQSHRFRNFIAGAHAGEEPVLVTAQGTYGNMFLQAWHQDMTPRWKKVISKDEPGARGSHMLAITDLDRDGVFELMWGERCIELDRGEELFCADRDHYSGHSDIIQPLYDWDHDQWYIYTCRETEREVSPRVILFNDKGERVWEAVDEGHIHMGWVARLGDGHQPVASAVRIGHKTFGPYGYINQDLTEFTFDALTGEPCELPLNTVSTLPVDLNGDGYHELVRTIQCSEDLTEGEVLDRHGNIIGNVGSPVAMASKILKHPGEQLLAFHPEGKIRIWGDRNAEDTPEALRRYDHPVYKANQRMSRGRVAGI